MEDEDEMLDETEPTPDGADAEEPAEGTPEGDPDPDAAEEGEDPTDDGEAEDDDAEDEGEGALPRGVRQRLAKVTAKRRAAEARAKELEDEVARLRDRAESPALYRALAERHGILPDLIGEREAKGLRDLDEAERGAEALRDLLEELEDNGESETELDGRTVTRAQLRKSLREQERRARDLRERHGEVHGQKHYEDREAERDIEQALHRAVEESALDTLSDALELRLREAGVISTRSHAVGSRARHRKHRAAAPLPLNRDACCINRSRRRC